MSGRRRRLTPIERQAVYDKMGGHCAYCGSALEKKDMQVDHVVPLWNGGVDELDNMLPACRSCNHYKRGNSLEGWRKMIESTPDTLMRDCYTFRQAIKFGRVTTWPGKVTFYFEMIKKNLTKEETLNGTEV